MNANNSDSKDQEGVPGMKRTEEGCLGLIYPEVLDETLALLGSKTVQSQEVTCDWTVNLSMPEFFNSPEEEINWISSPVFHLGDKIDRPTQWRVQIGYRNKERSIGMYLWRLDPANPKTSEAAQNNWTGIASVHYRFDILDKDGRVAFGKENGLRNMEIGGCFGWRTFVSYQDIQPCLSPELKLRIFLKIQKLDQNEASSEEVILEQEGGTGHISGPGEDNPNIYIDIYNSNGFVTNCPINLIHKGSKFNSMIVKSEGVEAPLIQLGTGSEAHLIRALVEFMKKGSCPILERKDVVGDLRSVSDKISLCRIGKEYEVLGIEEACYKSMIENLTQEDFVEIAIFSDVQEIELEGRPGFLEDFNQLKRFFLDNMETIKKLDNFRAASVMHGAYFVELVLAPPAKPKKTGKVTFITEPKAS